MGDVSRLFSDDGTLGSVHQSGGWVNGDAKVEAAMRDLSMLQSVQRTFCDREAIFASKTILGDWR
jgi:hypothetical protein